MRVFLLLFYCIFCSLAAVSQIVIEQWEVTDVPVEVAYDINLNPFDINIVAEVSSESGTKKLPLFYNGANQWTLRFSSGETGDHSYWIKSEYKIKSGQKGVFRVVPTQKSERHGGVVLDKKEPQKFFYEDGSHYFCLAYECDWLFALDYAEKELSKTETLLQSLSENGINQVVMNVYAYDVSWKKDSLLASYPQYEYGGKEAIFPFHGSNENPDFSRLNLSFFNHFDKVIAALHDKEIVSHLMIYVWNKMVNWPEMQSVADNRYFDYVIKRYQAYPNVVWDISKEALFYGRASEEYIHERIERIRSLDQFNRLVTVHDFGYCSRNPEKVDFISTQNWTSTLYNAMLGNYQKFTDKPVFNIEHGGYEQSPFTVFTGSYIDPKECLKRNYMCLFAGVYSTYYWQGTSWNVLIHNPLEGPNGFSIPKFNYYKNLRFLFDSFDFGDFKPYPKANSSGYCLKDESDKTYLFYLPKETYEIKLWNITQKVEKKFNYQWFNTITGELSAQKDGSTMKGDGQHSPWYMTDDSILILRL